MYVTGEYQRIVRDLASIGDTATVSATKEGIKFSTTGDIGTANITLRCGMPPKSFFCLTAVDWLGLIW